MEIIDTHCHLDVDAFSRDRIAVMGRCHELGITRIIVPAIRAKSWKELLTLCEQEAGLYPALGLHPVFIDEHQAGDIKQLEALLETVKPVAIGEIGLDFYLKDLDRQRQTELFEQQLQIASQHQLPVILHIRKAHDQALALLKKYKVKGGFAHAFNGSLQQAKEYIELGFKLGFGGTLTYENASKIHALAKELPLESMVLETDAPDMVVDSHRGQRNSPEYIMDSLIALATLRHQSIAAVAEQTTKNADAIIDFAAYDRNKQH